MTFDEIKARVDELTKAANESARNLESTKVNHDVLVGRLRESSEMFAYMQAQAKEVLAAVEAAKVAEKSRTDVVEEQATAAA